MNVILVILCCVLALVAAGSITALYYISKKFIAKVDALNQKTNLIENDGEHYKVYRHINAVQNRMNTLSSKFDAWYLKVEECLRDIAVLKDQIALAENEDSGEMVINDILGLNNGAPSLVTEEDHAKNHALLEEKYKLNSHQAILTKYNQIIDILSKYGLDTKNRPKMDDNNRVTVLVRRYDADDNELPTLILPIDVINDNLEALEAGLRVTKAKVSAYNKKTVSSDKQSRAIDSLASDIGNFDVAKSNKQAMERREQREWAIAEITRIINDLDVY